LSNTTHATTLDPPLELQLARYCYVLSLYEALFRANVVNSPLFSLPQNAPPEAQLPLVPQGGAADIVALTSQAVTTFADSFTKPFVANPTFAGSADARGADADFILDGCLIDIKTTTRKGLPCENIYQLLGYVVLDYDNRYNIDSVGFYLSRVPVLITWRVEEVFAVVSASKETVDSMRQAVRGLLQRC
jgi:hypothetical protein